MSTSVVNTRSTGHATFDSREVQFLNEISKKDLEYLYYP